MIYPLSALFSVASSVIHAIPQLKCVFLSARPARCQFCFPASHSTARQRKCWIPMLHPSRLSSQSRPFRAVFHLKIQHQLAQLCWIPSWENQIEFAEALNSSKTAQKKEKLNTGELQCSNGPPYYLIKSGTSYTWESIDPMDHCGVIRICLLVWEICEIWFHKIEVEL